MPPRARLQASGDASTLRRSPPKPRAAGFRNCGKAGANTICMPEETQSTAVGDPFSFFKGDPSAGQCLCSIKRHRRIHGSPASFSFSFLIFALTLSVFRVPCTATPWVEPPCTACGTVHTYALKVCVVHAFTYTYTRTDLASDTPVGHTCR